MKFLSRVVWSEGMYLAPHHFQMQSRYFEDSLHFSTSALWFRPYGISECQMDPEALQNGTVSVLHARGVLPDGTPFHIPESDPAPLPREIGDAFSPTRDSHVVLLALPARRTDGQNYAPNGDGDQYRFIPEPLVFRDETNGRDEKPVHVGKKNFRLILDTEADDDLTALPLARIRRSGTGYFVYDPAFVPPCLTINASPWLIEMLGRLIEMMEEKAAAIGAPRRQAGSSLGDYFRREISSFWFLHTVHSSLAPLEHMMRSKQGHPEELYRELVRLGGALCSFALNTHPSELPAYDHERLGECFAALDTHIRAHLDLIIPTNFVAIPLTRVSPYTYRGEVADSRCLGPSRWILGIYANVNETEVISRTPQLVKVCSHKFIPELVRRAVPGMTLTHLPVPPPTIPARVESHYFSVGKSGGCWEHIVKTKEVGIYVPGEFPDPQLELLVVLES